MIIKDFTWETEGIWSFKKQKKSTEVIHNIHSIIALIIRFTSMIFTPLVLKEIFRKIKFYTIFIWRKWGNLKIKFKLGYVNTSFKKKLNFFAENILKSFASDNRFKLVYKKR